MRLRAGPERNELQGRPRVLGKPGRKTHRSLGRWLCGPQPRKPQQGLDFFLARDLDAPAPRVAGCAHGTQPRRCAGSRPGGAAQARPAGGGGARSSHRAHTRARTLGTHTWSSSQEGGGEASQSECLKIERLAEERETPRGGRRRAREAGTRRAGPRPACTGGLGGVGADAPRRCSAPGPAGSAR